MARLQVRGTPEIIISDIMHCAQLGPLPQVKGTPGGHFMDLGPLFPQGPLFLDRILE